MHSLIASPYINAGNELVLSLVPADTRRILDVGCGAGDNARRLKAERTGMEIVGITHSAEEADLARPFLDAVCVGDVEVIETGKLGAPFDLLLFSHVLEHLRDPVAVVGRLLPALRPGGYVLIAVPNTLEWRSRYKLLRGQFKYADHGIFDRTHLRFFTYETAPQELVAPLHSLRLEVCKGRGSAPLGPLRRWLLPARMRAGIDAIAVRFMPNLFANEVAMLARLDNVRQDPASEPQVER